MWDNPILTKLIYNNLYTMKRILLAIVCAAMAVSVSAQKKENIEINYMNATDLTLVGKLCETTNPYHRVEVENIPELRKGEAVLLRMASGLAIAFKTDAKNIYVNAKFGPASNWNPYATLASTTGFNLFIKDEAGQWMWAASKVHRVTPNKNTYEKLNKPLAMIKGMAEGKKECLLYLPLYAELLDVEIGVEEGATIEKLANPFRHKIAVFGSSFTHGSCASGAGLTWPAFLSRATGLHLCSFGMSGNSKLQEYLGAEFAKAKPDALICDAFSNPSISQIGARIRPFIEAVRRECPNIPIIFLNTIYRESRNFIPSVEKKEQDRIEYVEKLLPEIAREYKGVYFVNVPDQTGTDHITSADGIHPYSYGYHRWAKAIQKPVVKILKKHGIK